MLGADAVGTGTLVLFVLLVVVVLVLVVSLVDPSAYVVEDSAE
jgi:hypothetical protein